MSLYSLCSTTVRKVSGGRIAEEQVPIVLALISGVLIVISLFIARNALQGAPADLSEVEHLYAIPVEDIPSPVQ